MEAGNKEKTIQNMVDTNPRTTIAILNTSVLNVLLKGQFVRMGREIRHSYIVHKKSALHIQTYGLEVIR